MNATLELDAKTETFHDCQHILKSIAAKFHRTYGGNYDDILSDTYYYFLIAFDKHTESKGPFIPWIRNRIFLNLLDQVRTGAMRNARLPRTYPNLEELNQTRESLRWVELYDEFSEDAKTVLELALHGCPEEKENPQPTRDTGSRIRQTIQANLRRAGWTISQVTAAFQEIHTILQEELR